MRTARYVRGIGRNGSGRNGYGRNGSGPSRTGPNGTEPSRTGRRRGAALIAAGAAVPVLLLCALTVPAAADPTTPATGAAPTAQADPTAPADPTGSADPTDPAAPADPAAPLTIEAPETVTLPPMVTDSDNVKITVGFGKDKPGHPTGPRTITVDTTDAAAVAEFFQFPDCDQGASENIHVCPIPHATADGSDTVTFTVATLREIQGGPEHVIKYTGSWGGVQATPAVTRVRVGSATDLYSTAPRPSGIKPNDSGALAVTVTNKGLVGADAFLLEAYASTRAITLVKDPACTYDKVYGRDHMVCRYDEPVAPGGTAASVRPVRFSTQGDSFNEEITIAATALVSPGPGKPPVADHTPRYNGIKVRVVTGADFRATGAHLSGPVGAKVKARFSFVNAGPAYTDDGPAMLIYVTVPKGTEAVDVPRVCDPARNADGSDPDPKHPARYECYLLNGNGFPGIVHTLDYTFKIVSPDVSPGEVSVRENSHAHPTDPDPTNNKAPITVTVTGSGGGSPTPGTTGGGSGGTNSPTPTATTTPGTSTGDLASTGSPPAALIAATAATVTAVGGLAFAATRRRTRR